MNKIKVDDLQPGMKFTRAVYITPTNMLVGPDMPLKSKDIDRLKRWGIKEVETSGEVYETEVVELTSEEKEVEYKDKLIEQYKQLHKIKHKFLIRYEDSADAITKMVQDVRRKKLINNMKIYNIATDMITEVTTNAPIFIYLASKMSNDQEYLSYHLLNASIFSILIGHLNKVPPKKIINLAVGSLLYDIGMAKIPQAIILKKEKLNIKELNFIKLHTIYGYKILVKDSNFPSEIASIALQHHEQFDGNGYPRKLRNEQIDLFSRIVAIADTFEAMTKKRTYRTEFLSYEAMKNLLGQSKNKFDPKLLRTFLANMSIYPIASLVKLNTNAIGLVIGAYEDKPLRPIIKIIIDEFNDKVPEEESRFVDLTKTPDLYITNAVDERQYQLNLFDYI